MCGRRGRKLEGVKHREGGAGLAVASQTGGTKGRTGGARRTAAAETGSKGDRAQLEADPEEGGVTPPSHQSLALTSHSI